MTIEQIKCNGCGKIKQEANHWFCLYIKDGLFTNGIMYYGAGEMFSILENRKDFCGQACLIKEIQELTK